VRLRTKVTKGPGSRMAGLAMAFKLIEAAQGRWRAVNAPHLVPLVAPAAGNNQSGDKVEARPSSKPGAGAPVCRYLELPPGPGAGGEGLQDIKNGR